MAPVRPWRAPRQKVQVRSTAARAGVQRFGFFVFRAALYGFLGVALEVCFYNLVKFSRGVPGLDLLFRFQWKVDPALGLDHVWAVPLSSLYGQCSLWMFFVYLVACLAIEQLYLRLFALHWALRAVAYGLTIFSWECLSGWLLLWGTGYRIWYYADAGAFFEMTSWFILPLWIITGLLVEYLFRQLMDPQLVHAIETATLAPEFSLKPR